ncbi:MAG: patatin-like phospholipase family protein [Paludibacter sp.]|nr:patatin-like phospholipase family protein [Paludibacter sp.]
MKTKSLSVMFRKIFLLFLLLPILFVASAQPDERPRVALVLSGGGAKGFAHLGVLKVLEQEEIPIDIIVGTSIGSIVGGLYAIGYSADDIIQLAKDGDWPELLSDYVPRRELNQVSKTEQQRYVISLPIAENKFPVLPGGMVNGQNVLNLFCGLAANLPQHADFSKFPIPFACIGTDLETGKEIVMNEGFLPTAIFSSMAIPGVFVPGKHNGYLLVDGGLVNNFPTDVAKKMGADIIIGVDLRKDLYQAEEIASLDKLTNQIINFYSLNKDSVNKSLCNIIIRPDITGYNTSSFNRQALDTLMKRGTKSAMDVIDQIRALKKNSKLLPRHRPSTFVDQQKWNITGIRFSGNYSISDKLLTSTINKKFPGEYSYEDIKQSINTLYGTGVFKRVYFKLDDDKNGKILNIFIEEGKAWNFNVGIRLNTRSGISVVLNSTRKDYTKTFGLLSFTADVSANPAFSILAELDKEKLPTIAIQADGSFNQATIYSSRNSYFDAKLYNTSLKLYTYQPFLKHSTIGLGIKQEFYGGEVFNINGNNSENFSAGGGNFFYHLYSYYHFDSLNDYYFPTRGAELYTEFSLTEDLVFNIINPIWLLKNRNSIPLSRKSTLMMNAYARTLFSEVPLQLGNFIASKDYEVRFNHHLPFYGLPSFWATGKNTFIGCLEFRSNLYRQHHLSLAANLLFHSNEFNKFESYKSIWGAGLTYSYKSPFGPIEFTLGYSDAYRKIVAAANIGFWF